MAPLFQTVIVPILLKAKYGRLSCRAEPSPVGILWCPRTSLFWQCCPLPRFFPSPEPTELASTTCLCCCSAWNLPSTDLHTDASSFTFISTYCRLLTEIWCPLEQKHLVTLYHIILKQCSAEHLSQSDIFLFIISNLFTATYLSFSIRIFSLTYL